ncbi:MAG: signal peptidase I [archaeon]
MNLKKAKKLWNKFWFIVWKDDSFIGWVLSILFIFIFIKFIFFPVLGLITGTSLPLAIVESCSMYHDGPIQNFDSWYEKHDSKYSNYIINNLDFQDFIFHNGFNKGDILFVIGVNPDKLEVGEVIIFNGGQSNPIIHRIIDIKEEDGKRIFSTLGDNNPGQLVLEKRISEDQIVGKAVFKVAPYLGWGKLIFFEPQQPESNKGFCDEN